MTDPLLTASGGTANSHLYIVRNSVERMKAIASEASEKTETALASMEALAAAAASQINLGGITYSLETGSWSAAYTTPYTDPVEPTFSGEAPSDPTLEDVGDITSFNKTSAPTVDIDTSGAPGDAPTAQTLDATGTVTPFDKTTAPTADIDLSGTPGSAPTNPTLASTSTVTPFSKTNAPDVDIDFTGKPGSAPNSPTLESVGTITPFNKTSAPDISIDMTGAPGDGPDTSLTTLPELTALTLPTFSTTVPANDVEKLTTAYSYAEPTYTELVKDETQAELTSVLGGALIIPTAVWDALWDRAVGDIAKVQVADTWAASNIAAGLSMSGMVSEALTSRLESAQQRTSDAAAKVKLEQSIQEANQRREDLWQAIIQGIAFEGLWLTHHEALAGRALASAAKAHEALVAATNVNILRFNSLLRRVEIEIEADRLELELALAPLQEIAAEIQIATLRVQYDEQQIKRWLGLWEGWKTDKTVRADVIKSQVQSWGTEMQAESNRLAGDIEVEKLTLSENDQLLRETEQQIKRWLGQWEGWKTDKMVRADVLKTQIDAWGIEMQGESARLSGDIDIQKLTLAKNDQLLQQLEQQIKQWLGQWEGWKVEKTVSADVLKSLVDAWAVEMQSESARLNGDIETEKLTLAGNEQKLKQDDQEIKRWLGQWEGWKADKTVRTEILKQVVDSWGTEMQAESSRLNGDIEVEKLTLAKNAQELEEFSTKWNGIAIKSKAVNDLYGARISASNLALEDKKTELDYQRMALGKAIEEAWREPQVAIEKAKLQVDQTLGVLQRIAELQTGLAQAYLAGSDASTSASAAANYGYSCSGVHEDGCP